MKKLTTLCALLLAGATLKAQQYIPFPTSDAQWNVAYYQENCEGLMEQTVCYYHLADDSAFNGHTYKKVFLIEIAGGDVGVFSGIVGGIREEEKKIYFYSFSNHYLGSLFGGKEALLYDFNAAAGDTIVADSTAPYIYSIIEQVDSVNIGNVYRKQLKTSGMPITAGRDEYWVEGIGSLAAGLITSLTPIPTCGHHETKLICFKQNGNVVYLNPEFGDCNGWLSVAEAPKAARIRIYPNPAIAGAIRVENVDPADGLQARITDYAGRVLLTQPLEQRDNIIRLPRQTPFCMLVLSDKNGQILRVEKVINR